MTPHQRLDRFLDERRLELDMDWTQLGRVAGMSYAALRNIRRGQSRPSPRTKRRLEDALGWERGSIDAILDGGEPTGDDEPALYSDKPFSAMTDEELGAYMREHYPEVTEELVDRRRVR